MPRKPVLTAMRHPGRVREVLLHIGPDPGISRLLQAALQLAPAAGWHVPRGLGRSGHTRLFLAALDPDHVDPLRAARGFGPEDRHAKLTDAVRATLAQMPGDGPILMASDLFGRDLTRAQEIRRLADWLAPCGRVTVVLQAFGLPEALIRHWSGQIVQGRVTPLEADLAALRDGCRLQPPQPAQPELGLFPELEAPPGWLDPQGLRQRWLAAFDRVDILADAGALAGRLGIALPPPDPAPLPSAQTLARLIAMNPRLRAALGRGLILPRRERRRLAAEIAVEGPPLDPAVVAAALAVPGEAPPLLPPLDGFDPDAALRPMLPRLLALTRAADIGENAPAPEGGAASPRLPKAVRNIYARLVRSRYAPHNRNAPALRETAPFLPAPLRAPHRPERVIVACVKDEAPYLLEWVSYHRAIGFDHIVIFSNDCNDGTVALLDLLARRGWLTHLDNSAWTGQSPQQAALNRAVELPLVREADWVLHIDLDEFVNIRCGNGTLDDLFAACPEATHFALTWRLFGSAGVQRFADRPVIAQFIRCAPAFCPKPHTAWGFKTLGRQNGVYGKLSCHRPTKPDPGEIGRAVWVNGAGHRMGAAVAAKGWRSSIADLGYDLVQLNHYALRSRDSFLVKRKRGRALHVDREIGRNYWLRMDWNDHEDRSILRNLPRLQSAIANLMADPAIAAAHLAGVDWHRQRAIALRSEPEMAALLAEIEGLDLTQTERAAWAMTLDMES